MLFPKTFIVNLMDQKSEVNNLRTMIDDPSLTKMKDGEDHGLRVYNTRGGRFAVTNPEILENHYAVMCEDYLAKEREFKSLRDSGVSFVPEHDPSDTNFVDLHHGDISGSDTSDKDLRMFMDLAEKRHAAFARVRDYLIKTNQADILEDLPEYDVLLMKQTADDLDTRGKDITVKVSSRSKRKVSVDTAIRANLQDVGYDKNLNSRDDDTEFE